MKLADVFTIIGAIGTVLGVLLGLLSGMFPTLLPTIGDFLIGLKWYVWVITVCVVIVVAQQVFIHTH
ncbi:hypothetical protein [Priestia koreensis]|uniref:hypothetical protein n=1 Tax=Priestia koreensis TaxID=284581 RepID=UPI00301959B1